MNDLDRTTLDRFTTRFAAIERYVPDPPSRSTAKVGASRMRLAPIAALVGVVTLLLVVISILPIGAPPRPTLGPSASLPPTSTPTTSSPVTPPTGDQPGHPQLGGTAWVIRDVNQEPAKVESWIAFAGGLGQGEASGAVEADCFFIAFDYSYPTSGPGIVFGVRPEGDGSYLEGCSPAAEAQSARLVDALGRVTYWTMIEPDRLGLLGAQNNVLIAAEPPPPLPTPPPGGDCGSVPLDRCLQAATQAFNYGIFPASGQTIVSWRVEDTNYTICGSSGMAPRYDVTFVFANPDGTWTATVGERYGKLIACGAY